MVTDPTPRVFIFAAGGKKHHYSERGGETLLSSVKPLPSLLEKRARRLLQVKGNHEAHFLTIGIGLLRFFIAA